MPDWRSPAFDWDPWEGGNGDKLIARHDVYPVEAEQVFYNGAQVIRHGSNGQGEPRYSIYGQDDTGRYLFLVCVLRGVLVRVYSARDMTERERQHYRERRQGERR
ncbi:MAG TPA: BrnT family toxin [Thermomicrobiales bacterium]|nr:BrnT family toxin [Thermomicrobiales bacterium]